MDREPRNADRRPSPRYHGPEHERDVDPRDPRRLRGLHHRRHHERAEQGSDDQAEDVHGCTLASRVQASGRRV
jgi:hypothetical protein